MKPIRHCLIHKNANNMICLVILKRRDQDKGTLNKVLEDLILGIFFDRLDNLLAVEIRVLNLISMISSILSEVRNVPLEVEMSSKKIWISFRRWRFRSGMSCSARSSLSNTVEKVLRLRSQLVPSRVQNSRSLEKVEKVVERQEISISKSMCVCLKNSHLSRKG